MSAQNAATEDVLATSTEVSPQDLRRTMGAFATGVTVVTSRMDGVMHGMTANAFTSVSLDPPLVLVCIDCSLRTHDLIADAGVFAVTVLACDQEQESRHFASRRPLGEGFDEVAWSPAPATGSPVLDRGLAYLDCSVERVLDGGDHSIFLGRVLGLGVLREECDPLVFFGGGYRGLVPTGDD